MKKNAIFKELYRAHQKGVQSLKMLVGGCLSLWFNDERTTP